MSAQIELDSSTPSPLLTEAAVEPLDVCAHLSVYLGSGVEVVAWDAYNVDIYKRAEQLDSYTLRNRLGGAMVVTCVLKNGTQRFFDIDDERRPLAEEVISVIGATAGAKPTWVRMLCGQDAV